MAKRRLDIRVLEHCPHVSRTLVQSLILQGKVRVDGQVITKVGVLISDEAELVVDDTTPKYVSRAGFKLEAALDHFNVDVTGYVVLDAGLSTGGFTDCLLQRGAQRVYGIDVGYGQVHERIRSDTRVVVMERTNVRYLKPLPEKVDLVTLDVSFISLLKIMPAVLANLKQDGRVITLIKPQFEADRSDIRSGGVVKDAIVYERVILKVQSGMREFGYEMVGVLDSPIRGATSKNKEFLALFKQT